MTEQEMALVERFVLSWEKIATALEGFHEDYKRYRFPQKGPVREAVVTRVPSQEDRIREAQQGSGDKTLMEWLDESPNDEDIGVREREWLERNNAGAKTAR